MGPTAALTPPPPAIPPDSGSTGPAQRSRTRSGAAGNLLLALAGLALGALVGATLISSPMDSSAGLSGWLIGLGALAAVTGTYGVLVLLVLIARIPPLERAVGQPRLLGWHRRLAPWSLSLVGLHVLLTTLGYAAAERTDPLGELAGLIVSTPWILPATAGLVLLVVAAVTSWRVARRRLSYETWWTIHLYTYLGVAAAFAHQIVVGGPFVSTGWARTAWIVLYLAVAASIVTFRVGLPVYRSLRHDLRVERVVAEGPGVASVWLTGRSLHRLPARPGQYLAFRFADAGLRWQAHPYSLSAPVAGNRLRITVKALGDGSARVAALRPGMRAFVEGPYGTFTSDQRRGDRVVLIGAGVGIAPLRAMLEALPPSASVDLLYRAHGPSDFVLRQELEAVAARRPRTRLRLLAGPRTAHPMTADSLGWLVPDIDAADVFVCGPDGFTTAVVQSLRELGTPDRSIHSESFDLEEVPR